jgi:hypothetical protein
VGEARRKRKPNDLHELVLAAKKRLWDSGYGSGVDMESALRDLAEAAAAAARRARDATWIEEAQRGFEGVRDPLGDPSLVDGWKGHHGKSDVVPCFVLHEVWKRDPRVEAERERIAGHIRGMLELAQQHRERVDGVTPSARGNAAYFDGKIAAYSGLLETLRQPRPSEPA